MTTNAPQRRSFGSGVLLGVVVSAIALFLCLRFFPFATQRVLDELTFDTDLGKSNRVDKAQLAVYQAEDADDRWLVLDDAAMLTAQFGDLKLAETFATELLRDAPQHLGEWNYGNAYHKGHQALGIIALRRNDLATAKAELLEAGRTPGSPQLDSFGPNMTLAKLLLERGERAIVLEYFSLCRVFWEGHFGKLDDWTIQVKAGRIPDFGANLVF